MESAKQSRLGAHLAGLVSVVLVTLVLSTAAHAQSREDQYGSPTDRTGHESQASGALSVLPETGGPLVLFAGTALVAAGAGAALVRRRAGRG